jgi:pentatricopeptide repeat protein
MRKAGITPTKTTATPVAQWLGNDTSAILQARQALTALHQHHEPADLVAFNMLIHAFAYNDEFDEALATFAMADELGITPDEDTLDALLDACIHQRNTKHGEHLYHSFIRAGIKPTVVSLSKMVALMCTQDYFEDAFVYLEKIKKSGQLPLRGAYYRLIKKLSASNDPRLPMAIEDMEACGYSLSSHLDDYMDDKAFLHEKRERIREKRLIAEAEDIA